MKTLLSILFALVFAQHTAVGNYLQISNVTLTGQNTTSDYTMVQFDVSWWHSWRDNMNWDAAWVIVKWSSDLGATWNHAKLNTTPGNHSVPSGAALSVGMTGTTAMGVFLYRSASGSGTNNWTNVQLRWEYGLDGVADNAGVIVRVFGIEMVHIPLGSFNVGDGSSQNITGQFEAGNSGNPYQITGEGMLTLGGTSPSNLSNHNASGMTVADDFTYTTTQTLPAAFPKGYNAFYCMKYEITQEQYKDFLNTLTRTQQGARVGTNISGTSITNRYVMSNTTNKAARNGLRCDATLPAAGPIKLYGDYDGDGIYDESTDGQNIACNYLYFEDLLAYLDWAGLRPMSELEFEKACRGPMPAIADEYAWGTANITQATGITNPGEANESASNTGANCSSGNQLLVDGPIRACAFAGNTTDREGAGASYWGVMELSGNLNEYCFQVGSAQRRTYTGLHGDGSLDVNGAADVTNWNPTVAVGWRGGNHQYSNLYARTSDRSETRFSVSGRHEYNGGRGVRTAP